MKKNEEQWRKELKMHWNELPLPRVSWETFKRLARQNKSFTHTIQQAIKIANKQQL